VPGSARAFGTGDGEAVPDSLEFSIRKGAGTNENEVNIPQITVNIGGNVTTFEGTSRQINPSNVRMPIVLKVSQSAAEFYVNGVRVVQATGFNLPFTQGYWVVAHRGFYASRADAVPIPLQLLHWETIQFDGPTGSYNSVVKSYIQPGC